MGYVGLTLAIYMAKKGSNVVVIDNEFNKKLGITQNIDSYIKKIK